MGASLGAGPLASSAARRGVAPPSAAAAMVAVAPAVLADRVAGALWGMFIADALAMPTHWFYGGRPEVQRFFGGDITTYRKSPHPYPQTIMALSNTGGAGRGGNQGDIIGDVINHGKKKYWERGAGYHYHCSLEPGETTLEGEMARLMVRHLNKGPFDAGRMQEEYVEFMTTPGSHNDAYASTYHRMFFANRAKGLPLKDCPDNDAHNVDAIDGLIVPVPMLLATALAGDAEAVQRAQASVSVTRKSKVVEGFVPALAGILRPVLAGTPASEAARNVAVQMYGAAPNPSSRDPVVACYIDNNFQSMLHFLVKYKDFREGVLANANAGGENVHRGLVLGAILGAEAGASNIPKDLKSGLRHSAAIEKEIQEFVQAHILAEEGKSDL